MSSNSWNDFFRLHIQFLEDYLQHRKESISGEPVVYLAGLLARHPDRNYSSQVADYILEDPADMDRFVRQHDPYLGQNAPIVSVARLSAEYKTARLVRHTGELYSWHMRVPARYFGIAAYYAHQSGNRTLSGLYSFLQSQYGFIIDILRGYIAYLTEKEKTDAEISESVWNRFATESNERNDKKEWWAKRGIDLSKKDGLGKYEFNRMIDFTSAN